MERIWKTVQDIWRFLNTPGKDLIKIPDDSFLARFWRILTTPMNELIPLSWGAVAEFLQVACLLVGMGGLLLSILGARGKVSKCLYWSVAVYFALQIMF